MKFKIVIIAFLLIPSVLTYPKQFPDQQILNVTPVKETILRVPFNVPVSIQFPNIIRDNGITPSVTDTNQVSIKRDKEFMNVSLKTECSFSIILIDGSRFVIRLIPDKTVSTMGFDLTGRNGKGPVALSGTGITSENGNGNIASESQSPSLPGSEINTDNLEDVTLISATEQGLLLNLYDVYWQMLKGNRNIVSRYENLVINKLASQYKTIDIVEYIRLDSAGYAGIVFELRNNGILNISLKEDDMIPFLQSFAGYDGQRNLECYFIDSYEIPAGKKTGLFAIYLK